VSSYANMLTYIPEYLRTSQVIISILNAKGIEIDQINTNIADVLLQFYVETATATGLALWENYLGLTSYSDKTLAQRRERIISKLRGMGTVTVAMIKNVAESFVYGQVTVTEHPELYSFTIKFSSEYGIPAHLDDVQAAIELIKPAHLGVVYEFTYMNWDEFDTYNKTWDQWDALNLTWIEFEAYREVS